MKNSASDIPIAAVVGPSVSAIVTMTVSDSIGRLRRLRVAYRASCQSPAAIADRRGASRAVRPDAATDSIYPFRIAFWIAGFLGGLGVVFTLSGIYGVLSYLVGQRTKEIGIRIALGARGGAVVHLVVSQCVRLVAIGAAIGVSLALVVAPVFANRVEAIQPYDAVAYVGALLSVAVAAVAASFRPVQKAVAVDPVTALRCD